MNQFFSSYGRNTSLMAVETTGLPAAKNSGVLVGLINLVDSFSAKGIMAQSQPAR